MINIKYYPVIQIAKVFGQIIGVITFPIMFIIGLTGFIISHFLNPDFECENHHQIKYRDVLISSEDAYKEIHCPICGGKVK